MMSSEGAPRAREIESAGVTAATISRLLVEAAERSIELAAKVRRIDPWVADQRGLDLGEQLLKAGRLDQAALDHRLHVRAIELEVALDLRQRLRVRIEVPDGHLSLPKHERAALSPPGKLRDEVWW